VPQWPREIVCVRLNETYRGDGADHLQARLRTRLRGSCVEASGLAVPGRPLRLLDQDREPGRTGVKREAEEIGGTTDGAQGEK
jgi:hypothetical protein